MIPKGHTLAWAVRYVEDRTCDCGWNYNHKIIAIRILKSAKVQISIQSNKDFIDRLIKELNK